MKLNKKKFYSTKPRMPVLINPMKNTEDKMTLYKIENYKDQQKKLIN